MYTYSKIPLFDLTYQILNPDIEQRLDAPNTVYIYSGVSQLAYDYGNTATLYFM